MDHEILNSYSRLNDLNVSRETFLDFENYISMILEKNKKINIISQNTASKKTIIDRHIIDSAQIIDFVDLNSNTTTDLGSGGGLPGIIVAIILKNMKNNMNVHLYEKSYHKSHFLTEVSKKLNLKTKVFQKNIFEIKNLETGTIMSRAFKPMPVVLDLVYENFSKYKNLIFFMGKSGKKVFENSKKNWELEYTEKKSLTNEDSFLINIKKIKKKIKCK
ncbi:class I SAM-dependent methyltransferase [Candidatus Pelagibacter sp.]|nr:class I SAM-dependent methyltransferase [Candidatus Pelagibacter sp.]